MSTALTNYVMWFGCCPVNSFLKGPLINRRRSLSARRLQVYTRRPHATTSMLLLFVQVAAAAAGTYGDLVDAIFSQYNPKHPPPGGTTVNLGLNLYKVSDVDVQFGVLRLNVWVRMSWMDPRLRWDPTQWGGIDVVSVAGRPAAKNLAMSASSGAAQLWVPEIELVNGENSLADLPDKNVMVYSDGSAFWSRPGTLSASCTMAGLQNFPFDRLSCQLKFQGWTMDDRYQNISFYSPPWATEKVPKVSFQPYHLDSVTTTRAVDAYDCCPGGWPYLEFGLTIVRSHVHYIVRICAVNSLFITLAFGVLFVSPSARVNRLGFCITLMLTLTAADIVQSSYLPISDSVLWITWYIMASWWFAFLTTLESIIVLVLYNMPSLHHVARLGSWRTMFEGVTQQSQEQARRMRRWHRALLACVPYVSRLVQCCWAETTTPVSPVQVVVSDSRCNGRNSVGRKSGYSCNDIYVVPEADIRQVNRCNCGQSQHVDGCSCPRPNKGPLQKTNDGSETPSSTVKVAASLAPAQGARGEVISSRLSSRDTGSTPVCGGPSASRKGAPVLQRSSASCRRLSFSSSTSEPRLSATEHDATVLKSILSTDIDGGDAALVRQAFQLLDDEQRGHIPVPRVDAFLDHFGNLIGHDIRSQVSGMEGGVVDIRTFTHLCVDLIEDLGTEWFEKIIASVEATRLAQEEQLKLLWQGRAVRVDSWARWLLPLTYYACCIALFCMRLPDPDPIPLIWTTGV